MWKRQLYQWSSSSLLLPVGHWDVELSSTSSFFWDALPHHRPKDSGVRRPWTETSKTKMENKPCLLYCFTWLFAIIVQHWTAHTLWLIICLSPIQGIIPLSAAAKPWQANWFCIKSMTLEILYQIIFLGRMRFKYALVYLRSLWPAVCNNLLHIIPPKTHIFLCLNADLLAPPFNYLSYSLCYSCDKTSRKKLSQGRKDWFQLTAQSCNSS